MTLSKLTSPKLETEGRRYEVFRRLADDQNAYATLQSDLEYFMATSPIVMRWARRWSSTIPSSPPSILTD